jgi:hypothetical protein
MVQGQDLKKTKKVKFQTIQEGTLLKVSAKLGEKRGSRL